MKPFFINFSIGLGRRNVHQGPSKSDVRFRLTRRQPAPSGLTWALAAAGLLLCGNLADALTLADLKADKHLTPERLVKYFADFQFEPGRTVRKADDFLRSRRGDCDDFATLAADLLREKGYATRLVAVFMADEIHVVCYVAEVGGYLDYNRRKELSPVVKCDSDLASIGASVAKSFSADWVSASEYTFRNGEARFILTEFR